MVAHHPFPKQRYKVLSMSAVEIRPATLEHIIVWTQFARQMFHSTFEHSVSAENMQIYLDTEMNEQVFAKQLENPAYRTYYVWIGKELSGYIQLYYNPNESYQNITLELKRFYVAPHLQGKGVAAQMMAFCLDEVARLKEPAFWLGVWENNFKARSFYKKWNFEPIGEHIFVTGSESQRDLILARQIEIE
jgi:diamine N-acetyltransferase